MKGLYSFALEKSPINSFTVHRNRIKYIYQIFFFIQEVDTALVKLYTEINSPNLQHLVSSENCCTVADTISWLQKYEVQIIILTYTHGLGCRLTYLTPVLRTSFPVNYNG